MENFGEIIYSNYSRKKIIVISIGVALLILNTVLSAVLGEQNNATQAINFIIIIALNFLVFAWCHYDSLERGESFGIGWRFIVIILGYLALTIYLFKTRGFTKGLMAIGWFLLIVIGASVLAGLAATVAYLIIGVK